MENEKQMLLLTHNKNKKEGKTIKTKKVKRNINLKPKKE